MKPSYGLGLVVLAVLAVFGYDGVRTAMAQSSADDDATQYAHDAATFFHSSGSVTEAYQKILDEAASRNEKIPAEDFKVTTPSTVSLVVEKSNSTLVLGRLHQPWDVLTGSATSTWSP